MDFRLSTSFLPGIWVIETLAQSSQIDVSLLIDLLEKFPQTSDNLGRNARELVSFRILERFLFQGSRCNSPTSSSPKVAFDQSESCEDVLKRILSETPASSLNTADPDISKWDVQAFIALKRSAFGKPALQQLKDAILTGSYSSLASIKEQSGLSFVNQPEGRFLGKGGKHDDTMHRIEATDSSPRISKDNSQLITPTATNNNFPVDSENPNGNPSPNKQKRRSITIISRGESGKAHITSNDGEGRKEVSGESENEIIHCQQHLVGKLSTSVVNRHLEDTSVMIGQCSGTERYGLERSTNFQGTRKDGPPEDENNECSYLDDIGGNEVLLCKDQAPHCNTELPNDKSNDNHEDLCGPSSTEDVDKLECHIKDSVLNGEGEGKIQNLHCDTELPNDKYDPEHGQNEIRDAKDDKESFCDLNLTGERDKSEPPSKGNVQSEREGAHIGFDGQFQYSRYCLASNSNDLNILADVCTGADRVSQNITCLGSKEPNGPPGDVEFTSSTGLLDHDKVIHNHNIEQNHEDGNASDGESFLEPKISSGCKDGFEQEIHETVTDLGDSENVVTGESNGCLDERTDIETKKIAFLSSQCSFSQGSFDCRDLNVCVKCKKGGKLLVCSANSCRLVVHEGCLGSHASFGRNGEFQCPFCAYSQAISEYMDIREKVCLSRKDFATFVCLGTNKELKKHPHRSNQYKQHLEHGDGLNRSSELNNQGNAGHINNHKRKRKLEYEEQGCSTLSSGDNSPSGGKAVDSTNGKAHLSKRNKREMKTMRQSEMAASASPRSKGENAPDKDPGKNHGSKIHVISRSKNRVFRSLETHIVSEGKISRHSESADRQERSEENDDSRAPGYSLRVQMQKSQYICPEIPQLRRMKVPWTTAEEEKLKEGMRIYCPGERLIPWKKIMEFGSGVFLKSRSTVDLKDKWRNLYKASQQT